MQDLVTDLVVRLERVQNDLRASSLWHRGSLAHPAAAQDVTDLMTKLEGATRYWLSAEATDRRSHQERRGRRERPDDLELSA